MSTYIYTVKDTSDNWHTINADTHYIDKENGIVYFNVTKTSGMAAWNENKAIFTMINVVSIMIEKNEDPS